MMRYLKLLADKDIALNKAMIPLGSCTMKLNSNEQLVPLGWDKICEIHPFGDHPEGYIKMITVENVSMIKKVLLFGVMERQLGILFMWKM